MNRQYSGIVSVQKARDRRPTETRTVFEYTLINFIVHKMLSHMLSSFSNDFANLSLLRFPLKDSSMRCFTHKTSGGSFASPSAMVTRLSADYIRVALIREPKFVDKILLSRRLCRYNKLEISYNESFDWRCGLWTRLISSRLTERGPRPQRRRSGLLATKGRLVDREDAVPHRPWSKAERAGHEKAVRSTPPPSTKRPLSANYAA